MSLLTHPLLFWSACLLLVDVLLWHLAPFTQRLPRVSLRLVLFMVYSALIFNVGISPLQAQSWPDNNVLQLAATALAIIWWIYAARVLTELLGLILMRRIGHSGRLLQDVIGALVFLIAVVAAAGYVLELPVKGLLATSGAMAIIVGLALQSTLSDVFSGIVLNTTKPYQVDDWIVIDGVEGKVLDIDWRATHLLTSSASTAVIPNSVAAKAKLLNLSRPNDRHGVSISIQVPNLILKEAGEAFSEYVATGFIAELGRKGQVRNQLFDLAHRHLEAAGISRHTDALAEPITRARSLLDEVKIFRALDKAEREQVAQAMSPRQYSAGEVILDLNEVPDTLLVIGTGVVSVSVPDGNRLIEAGRMGPAEVMGEQSILADTPSQARFTALTSCIVYRLDKALTRDCMAQRTDVGKALNKLQAVRQQSSHALLNRPATPRKGGFLSWLQKS